MSERGRYVKLGLFVLFGVSLLVGALIVFGAGLLTRKGPIVETYLDESVQGLDVGAPIKQRGVKIGSVIQIGFVRDEYEIPAEEEASFPHGRLVLVRVRLSPEAGRSAEGRSFEEVNAARVAQGMRVRLATQGLTGTSYLEVDFVDPRRYPPLRIVWTPRNAYLPSAPSTIARIGDAAQRVFDRIDRLDIEGVMAKLDELLVGLNRAVGDAQVDELSSEASKLLAELRTTSRQLREMAAGTDLAAAQAKLDLALDRLTDVLDHANELFDTQQGEVAQLMASVRESAENLQELTRTARSYPSILLFSPPPKPYQPPEAPQ